MAYCVNAVVYAFAGGTRPSTELNEHEYQKSIMLYYVATTLYAPTALFVKICLILILIGLFQPYYSAKLALFALIALVISYYVIIIFVKIFICDPISDYWNVSDKHNANCLDQPSVIIADSVISFVTDVAIFVFPVFFTWSLQLPLRRKIKVMIILGFGGLAVGFSLLRLVIGIRESAMTHETTLFNSTILTANAEAGFGLLCACLPAFNLLFRRLHQQSISIRSSAPQDGFQMDGLVARVESPRPDIVDSE
jgi:hypothetical protein